MKPVCECDHFARMSQQISVMRKEIKNLRQMLDSAVRAHRKHLTSVGAAVSNLGFCKEMGVHANSISSPKPPQTALEEGIIQTIPIGFVGSCFSTKNGTPRQPTVCSTSRAKLKILKSVFNNPEHALTGLEQYSHVWIVFLFHKNGHLSCKAKVKPPRLDGQRVGVYSTRSPHRPNALGLTLAKLDKIEGDTLHLSDIDMIAGTPILDIKPYIPEYDCPDTRVRLESQQQKYVQDQITVMLNTEDSILNCPSNMNMSAQLRTEDDMEENEGNSDPMSSSATLPQANSQFPALKQLQNVLEGAKAFVNNSEFDHSTLKSGEKASELVQSKAADVSQGRPFYGMEAYTTIAGWIKEPPVSSLQVRFTPHAAGQLAKFYSVRTPGTNENDQPRFQFLHSTDEAVAAIRGVLSADPRSVYRRSCCRDRLFYFSLDMVDVTCWFGEDFAEVLQVRPIMHLEEG